jgi:hypothetical protein
VWQLGGLRKTLAALLPAQTVDNCSSNGVVTVHQAAFSKYRNHRTQMILRILPFKMRALLFLPQLSARVCFACGSVLLMSSSRICSTLPFAHDPLVSSFIQFLVRISASEVAFDHHFV